MTKQERRKNKIKKETAFKVLLKMNSGGVVKSNIRNLKIENEDMIKGQKIKRRKFMKGINPNNKSTYQIFMKMNQVIKRF